MSKITKFDKAACRTISERAAEALKTLADLGLTIQPRGGSYTATSYTLKIEFAIVGEAGVAMTREAQDFTNLAPLHGLSAADLGREFTAGGKRFSVVGWRARAGRRPVLARCTDGKEYAFPVDNVRAFLAADAMRKAEV